jgi:hypothetical protein
MPPCGHVVPKHDLFVRMSRMERPSAVTESRQLSRDARSLRAAGNMRLTRGISVATLALMPIPPAPTRLANTCAQLLLGAALFGCGGASVSAGDGADGGQMAMNEAAATPCPGTEPTAGGSCSAEGLQCEYGNDPSIACNKVYSCTMGAWSAMPAPFVAPGTCPTLPAAQTPGCPASSASLQSNTSCSTALTTCLYPDGSFLCVNNPVCMGLWVNGKPEAPVAGCPATRPQIGTYCTSTARICDYSCGLGASGGVSCGSMCGISDAFVVRCDTTTGTWSEGQSDCSGC